MERRSASFHGDTRYGRLASTLRSYYSYIPFYYDVELSELSNAVPVAMKKGRAVRTAL